MTNKIIASQSTRRPNDLEMRRTFLGGGSPDTPETNTVFEIRHERQPTEQFSWAVSAFWSNWDVRAFTFSTVTTESLATLRMYGIDLEAKYESDCTQWYASHGFTKLAGMTLGDPPRQNNLSAAPFGFGSDLNNWSNHITKFAVSHDINPCWSVDSSLRIYWGFPGAEDASVYNSSLPAPQNALGWIDPGYKKAFRGNYYLNFGAENHTTENLTVRADLHNVLGWLKPEYNKRNQIARMSDYRVEAPAVTMSLRYTY